MLNLIAERLDVRWETDKRILGRHNASARRGADPRPFDLRTLARRRGSRMLLLPRIVLF